MNMAPRTVGPHDDEQLDAQYRDDVREILEAEGWHETVEDCVVAPNGALWTETNTALDSGVDAPDKTWSVAFDSDVPAHVVAAAALAAAGADPVAEVRRLRVELATRAEVSTEYRLPPVPPAYTPLIVRRDPAYNGTRWAVLHDPGDLAVRRAWGPKGWEMAWASSDEEIYCWPDAETALVEARRAQGDEEVHRG